MLFMRGMFREVNNWGGTFRGEFSGHCYPICRLEFFVICLYTTRQSRGQVVGFLFNPLVLCCCDVRGVSGLPLNGKTMMLRCSSLSVGCTTDRSKNSCLDLHLLHCTEINLCHNNNPFNLVIAIIVIWHISTNVITRIVSYACQGWRSVNFLGFQCLA